MASGRRVLAFTAVAVLRFCTPGLIVSLVARSVLAYRAHRIAISLALRGKARRAPYTGGWRTCMRRLLAVGVTLESTETICNKDDICGRARVGRPPLRRYESATQDRLEVVREWATVVFYVGRTPSYRYSCGNYVPDSSYVFSYSIKIPVRISYLCKKNLFLRRASRSFNRPRYIGMKNG